MKYITKALQEKGITQKDLIKDLGVSQPYASALMNGKRVIGKKTAEKLSELYGLDYASLILDSPDQDIKIANAKFIGSLDDNEDEEGNTKFREISPGRYRMRVSLVTNKAKAGFLRGFSDEEYVEELPVHEVTVDFFYKSKYLAFEVEGDSMDDRTIYAIPDKTIVTGRVLDPQLWKPKLHSHNYPNWIFIHRTEGIIVKQIASQNLDDGFITIRSLNPDKDMYPDETIEVKDIFMILNVVKRELPF